jgi:hypothetical protein
VRNQGLVKFPLIKRHPIDLFQSLVNRFVLDWLDGFQSLAASVGLAPCKFGRLPQGSYHGFWGPIDSCQVCVCADHLLARLDKRVRVRRHLYQVKKLLVADRHRLWRLDLVRTFVRTARYLDVKFVTGREVLVQDRIVVLLVSFRSQPENVILQSWRFEHFGRRGFQAREFLHRLDCLKGNFFSLL